ncbi:hypothetical protein PG997_000951 [Apiospora hydei]|uniref:Uncharacterized protein n=1 Tax=Apiospora hydei TaxID=1337664 RepID=A0ABR1XC34_9PEZI
MDTLVLAGLLLGDCHAVPLKEGAAPSVMLRIFFLAQYCMSKGPIGYGAATWKMSPSESE